MNQITKKLFRWNRSLHRDIGYLCATITVIYAISGIAVNHIDEWNPNYVITRTEHSLPDLPNVGSENFHSYVMEKLDVEEKLKTGFQPEPNQYKIFLEESAIEIDLDKKIAMYEKIEKRPVLYAFNFLHLNTPKKAWTYIADVYAVLLAYLALSGLFMIRGKKGFLKRGVWFFVPGLLICVWGYFYYN